jgi:hypothetical protein
MAAFGDLNPAKHAPGPGSAGGDPAGAASLLVAAIAALGWNNPLQSGAPAEQLIPPALRVWS